MKKMFAKQKIKVCNGDEVVIICGKDKGKKGVVKMVFYKASVVLVDGVNKFKKAMKIAQGNTENFVFRERPLSISNVKVVKKAQKGANKKIKKDIKKESKN